MTEATTVEESGSATAPEQREREAAWRRGEQLAQFREDGNGATRSPQAGVAPRQVASQAFAALADNVRDYAIFLMDPHGVITFWGEGARLIKWWSKDQTEGGHLRMLYPSGGAEDGTAEGHLVYAAEHGEYTGEGRRVRSDGSLFWGGITLTALYEEDGTLLGFAKVTRDLTARRAADALLQAAAVASDQARSEAVAASAAKSGFLATMSHEIRTPINAVMGYHELLNLEIDGPLNERQRQHLARASASARHLLELISEVLDFSRIEAERTPVGAGSFRVGDAVGPALELVIPQARARGLELTDAVSGYAAGLSAFGDETRVRQILVNLLGNAVKFTSPRPGADGQLEPGRITVSAGTALLPSPDARLSGEGPWVYIRVEDTGAGIPAERLQAIFEAFVQADMTLTRRHEGVGLGLAISRRLARLMGGDVTVRSEEGLGSAFFLWLPAMPLASLESGGLEGHGPHTNDGDAGDAPDVPVENEAPGTNPLRAVAEALLGELERVLHAYVARLRSDPETPSAHRMSEGQVEDSLATFLADLASALQYLDVASKATGGVPSGAATESIRDTTAIQRVIAERHGAQRARMGWTEQEIHREFSILREETRAAIMRRAPRMLHGPNEESKQGETERVFEVLDAFLGVAERQSVASYWQEREARRAGPV